LEKEISSLKASCEADNQYNRRNNIELSGIPNEISDDELEDKVIEILKKIDVEVEDKDIEACHRLPSRKDTTKVIIRFVNRKKSEKCLKLKKKLSKLNMVDFHFSDDTKLFISENLNRYYQKLAWYCRRLKRESLIYSFIFKNESFLLQTEKSQVKKNQIKISNERQLFDLFPGFFFDEIIGV